MFHPKIYSFVTASAYLYVLSTLPESLRENHFHMTCFLERTSVAVAGIIHLSLTDAEKYCPKKLF